ncbi:MAG: site-specific integrase [Firmicutes bacterium]|nr:site-specific integrase [Bacillota bacterium]
MADIRLQALTALQVERALGELLAAGLSPRTAATRLTILKRALSDAVRWGLLPANPAARVKRPKWVGPEMRALDEGEAKQLAQAARTAEETGAGRKYARIILLALATGMRLSEILGLRWSDVGPRELSVRQGLRDGHTPHPPKTAAAMRTIPLADQALQALRRQRHWQLEQRLAWGPAWRQTDYVMTHEDGSPIAERMVELWYKRWIRSVGLREPAPRIHDLRHTWATLQLRAGTPVHVVSRLLGHSSIAVTLSVYAHVLPEETVGAAETADKWLHV